MTCFYLFACLFTMLQKMYKQTKYTVKSLMTNPFIFMLQWLLLSCTKPCGCSIAQKKIFSGYLWYYTVRHHSFILSAKVKNKMLRQTKSVVFCWSCDISMSAPYKVPIHKSSFIKRLIWLESCHVSGHDLKNVLQKHYSPLTRVHL